MCQQACLDTSSSTFAYHSGYYVMLLSTLVSRDTTDVHCFIYAIIEKNSSKQFYLLSNVSAWFTDKGSVS